MVLPNKKGVVNEMNAEIAKHYLSMPSKDYCLDNLPEDSNPKNIIQLLNNAFGNNWAWTIDSEQIIESNLITIVTLYIPGRICTGRSVTLSKGMAHYMALINACECISIPLSVKEETKVESESVVTQQVAQKAPVEQETVQPAQLSADDIMALVNQNDTPQVDNLEQFYNQKNEEVPFDSITDNCQQQLQNEMFPMNPPVSPQQQNTQSSMGFTDEQLARIRKLKQEYDMEDNQQFCNYIYKWSKGKFKSKSDLTPENIDDFISWVSSMG